jgi:acetyltransferase-like isoleucine patch superfamily enzyme
MEKIVIYGLGDNAEKVAYEYKQGKKLNGFELVGFVDDFKDYSVLDFPVLGNYKIFPELKSKGINNVLISLFKHPKLRLEKCLELEALGFNFPNLIGENVPGLIKVGKGVYIDNSVVFMGINQNIEDFSVIGPYSVIEGRTKIGRGCVLCPYAFLGYNSEIGEGSVLFPRSTILPNSKLKEGSVIGAHSLIKSRSNRL